MALSPQIARYGRNVYNISSNYTIPRWSGNLWLVDCTAGNITITLPAAANTSIGSEMFIKTDSSANTLTLSPSTGNTINGQGSLLLLSQYQCAVIMNDGTSVIKNVSSSSGGGTSTSDSLVTSSVIKTSNYTLAKTDKTILADCTGSNLTITLPTIASLSGAAGSVAEFRIIKVDAVNQLNLALSGSDLFIDGTVTYNTKMCGEIISLYALYDKSIWVRA